jgi:hypothetical protein
MPPNVYAATQTVKYLSNTLGFFVLTIAVVIAPSFRKKAEN